MSYFITGIFSFLVGVSLMNFFFALSIDKEVAGNLTCQIGIKFYSANGVMNGHIFVESGTKRKILPMFGNCFFVSR